MKHSTTHPDLLPSIHDALDPWWHALAPNLRRVWNKLDIRRRLIELMVDESAPEKLYEQINALRLTRPTDPWAILLIDRPQDFTPRAKCSFTFDFLRHLERVLLFETAPEIVAEEVIKEAKGLTDPLNELSVRNTELVRQMLIQEMKEHNRWHSFWMKLREVAGPEYHAHQIKTLKRLVPGKAAANQADEYKQSSFDADGGDPTLAALRLAKMLWLAIVQPRATLLAGRVPALPGAFIEHDLYVRSSPQLKIDIRGGRLIGESNHFAILPPDYLEDLLPEHLDSYAAQRTICGLVGDAETALRVQGSTTKTRHLDAVPIQFTGGWAGVCERYGVATTADNVQAIQRLVEYYQHAKFSLHGIECSALMSYSIESKPAPGRPAMLQIRLAGPFNPAFVENMHLRAGHKIKRLVAIRQAPTPTGAKKHWKLYEKLWRALANLFSRKAIQAADIGFVEITKDDLKTLSQSSNLSTKAVEKRLQIWVEAGELAQHGESGLFLRDADEQVWAFVTQGGQYALNGRRAGIESARRKRAGRFNPKGQARPRRKAKK